MRPYNSKLVTWLLPSSFSLTALSSLGHLLNPMHSKYIIIQIMKADMDSQSKRGKGADRMDTKERATTRFLNAGQTALKV